MAVAELWEAAKQAIAAYTGLSAAIFFTVLAVAGAFYYAVASFFPPPPPAIDRSREEEDAAAAEPLPPPVQLGEVSEEELRAYDGSDPKKPLLLAIKGQIYDVTQSRMFYGPGGPYALFAGRDASRALAKMSFEEKDLTGDISGLGAYELEALRDWEYNFMSKYVKVGTVKAAAAAVPEAAPSTSSDHAGEAEDAAAVEPTGAKTNVESEEASESGEPFRVAKAKDDGGSGDI